MSAERQDLAAAFRYKLSRWGWLLWLYELRRAYARENFYVR